MKLKLEIETTNNIAGYEPEDFTFGLEEAIKLLNQGKTKCDIGSSDENGKLIYSIEERDKEPFQTIEQMKAAISRFYLQPEEKALLDLVIEGYIERVHCPTKGLINLDINLEEEEFDEVVDRYKKK